ncbi:MAG: nitroreductase family protein [Massilibacteroides sp.]|nr:nitroreductase family protein [Massilibacteroides sp.]MDD3061527.1 nitroreductase family protein [Massilibacteroides sp.]MDD4114931.1 nitroreductase family protein [Massilibacteroides sp.]MDD4659183.1 nitroreductase family protein [Massilibacteroides sp.]
MGLLETSAWRYATKKFDPSKKVSQEHVDKIIEAARLAPTSSGLQPFQLLVITDQKIKEQLVPIAMGQEQVRDCSHLLVFAAWDNYTAERIDSMYDLITKTREQASDTYKSYTDRLKANYLPRPSKENFEHAARQTYIAFAYAIAMAAELKVDATPMEGFINEDVDKLLNLRSKGLKSVLLLPLGYHAEEDWLVNLKKTRRPLLDFVVNL